MTSVCRRARFRDEWSARTRVLTAPIGYRSALRSGSMRLRPLLPVRSHLSFSPSPPFSQPFLSVISLHLFGPSGALFFPFLFLLLSFGLCSFPLQSEARTCARRFGSTHRFRCCGRALCRSARTPPVRAPRVPECAARRAALRSAASYVCAIAIAFPEGRQPDSEGSPFTAYR